MCYTSLYTTSCGALLQNTSIHLSLRTTWPLVWPVCLFLTVAWKLHICSWLPRLVFPSLLTWNVLGKELTAIAFTEQNIRIWNVSKHEERGERETWQTMLMLFSMNRRDRTKGSRKTKTETTKKQIPEGRQVQQRKTSRISFNNIKLCVFEN